MSQAPEILYRPRLTGATRLEDLLRRLPGLGGPELDGFEALRRWSVREPDPFWLAVWRYFAPPATGEPTVALAEERMPGAVWFPQVALNQAEVALRMPGRADDDVVVVVARSQTRPDVTLTAAGLREQVARARAGLVRAGVRRGDRVAAYAPAVPETLVLMLATAALGAVFTSCAPEFGARSVLDRWAQVEPTLVLAVDGYRHGERVVDRRAEVEAVRAGLPGSPTLVVLPYLDPGAALPEGAWTWDELVAEPGPLTVERVPFATPLVVLFTSGTTGPPKAIVHSHGGIALEHLKALGLQSDLGPGDRYLSFTTTSWMMWNVLASALAVGTTPVMVDGNPAAPDLGMLWRAVDELDATYFGTSAPFLQACRRAGLRLRETADLFRLRVIGSTAAPLAPEVFRWVYDELGPDLLLANNSGGNDVAGGLVGASPLLPVHAGGHPTRLLGAAVQAWSPQGTPLTGEVGELVITRPMPSMPVGFWNDPDGSRYRDAYFDRFPGVWRHGDWITIEADGRCAISGRSDATLNRGGVRLGTAEFYAVVEDLPAVRDALVVHLEDDGTGLLYLFVVTDGPAGDPLGDDVADALRSALRTRLSPRHAPDRIVRVPVLPRTLTGKRLEVPVKRILAGAPAATVVGAGAVTDADALRVFETLRPHPAAGAARA
ncbi:acetoacetate--CoA ligase [Pseudonocardia alni]|uniref:acetoacetate--CoA ligase n=1 Tax=Pseudonocardia alni TaxID=33907 RepID=UPI0033DA4DFC